MSDIIIDSYCISSEFFPTNVESYRGKNIFNLFNKSYDGMRINKNEMTYKFKKTIISVPLQLEFILI
jgi:hypothetical protein